MRKRGKIQRNEFRRMGFLPFLRNSSSWVKPRLADEFKNCTKSSLSRSLIFIFLSVIVISGPAFLGLLYYQSLRNRRILDDRYLIRNIVQAGGELSTDYLCELLDLSVDRPTNLFQIRAKDAEERLRMSPLIEHVHVAKILPDTLFIEYVQRKPIAILGDYENTAIDKQGHPFPLKPYYDLQGPVFYLGDVHLEWNQPIKGHRFQTAKAIYRALDDVTQIDVSKINEKSYGRREIVVKLKDYTLRFDPENVSEGIVEFRKILDQVPFKGSHVIDLRISKLAFVD